MGFFTLTLHLINTIIFSTDKNESDQRKFLFRWKMYLPTFYEKCKITTLVKNTTVGSVIQFIVL